MRRIFMKKPIYSNCFLYSIYLSFRLKRLPSMIFIPEHNTVHFYVRMGKTYIVDFHPFNDGLGHCEQLWFKGTCRVRKRTW